MASKAEQFSAMAANVKRRPQESEYSMTRETEQYHFSKTELIRA